MTCCILHFAILLNNRLAFVFACLRNAQLACFILGLVSGPACLTQMLALGLAISIAWMALLGGAGLATQMLALFWQRVRVGFSLHVSSNPARSLATRLLLSQQLPWNVLPFRPPVFPASPERPSHSSSSSCIHNCPQIPLHSEPKLVVPSLFREAYTLQIPAPMDLPAMNAAAAGDRSATNLVLVSEGLPWDTSLTQ